VNRDWLRYANFPHTYNPPNLTENHGVPGSNPGPATSKIPAKHKKTRTPPHLRREFVDTSWILEAQENASEIVSIASSRIPSVACVDC
jgi:hypothetical protein